MPVQVEKSAMVTSPNGRGVILIGGCMLGCLFSPALIELRGNSIKTLEWVTLEQTLKYARRNHIAFCIPDALTKINKLPSNKNSRRKINEEESPQSNRKCVLCWYVIHR